MLLLTLYFCLHILFLRHCRRWKEREKERKEKNRHSKLPFHAWTMMQHSLYTGGFDKDIIQLFQKTFSHTEGEKEGDAIGELVQNFLENTPKQKLRVFVTTMTSKNDQEVVVGGVIFSKLTLEESKINTWILSPAAVATSMQGKGIGQGLIHYAHSFLKKQEGVEQVVTYGDVKFYSKVGYKPITQDMIPSPFKLTFPEGWLGRSLVVLEQDEDGNIMPVKPAKGKVYCVEALNKPQFW
jgi:Predicted acetyltransferase